MAFQNVGGISAPFTAVDESTGPLTKLIERIAGLQGALERLSDAISSASRGIGSAADGITRAVDSIDRIAAVLASSTEEARNFPSCGGSGLALGLFGGVGGREFGPSEGAMGHAFDRSIGEATDENQALTQTLAASNVPGLTGAGRQRDLGLLHEVAGVSAMGTIYTEQETVQAMLGTARMSGFTGAKGIEEFAGVFPSALTMAEVGEVRGLGSIADNLKAAIGHADLTQRHSTGLLAPGLDEIIAIAGSTGTSLKSIEATMKDGPPVATAAGTNIDRAIAAIGCLMSTGLGQSAGDAAGRMILGTLTTGGPMNAGLAQERAAVAQAMGQNAQQLRNMTAHAQALRNLGVTDAAGRLMVLNAEGGVDLGKILADIRSYGAHHSSADLADALHQAFGIRGMTDATLRALQQQSFADFKKTVAGIPGAGAKQAMFAATPLQQLEQSLARLQDIGEIMARSVIPEFGGLTKILLTVLNAIDDLISHHPVLARTLLAAGVGAGTGARLAGSPGALAGALGGAALANLPSPIEPWNAPYVAVRAPQPPSAPSQVTVNAPLTVTVQGDMLGDYASLSAFLSEWWEKNSGTIGDAVNQKIRRKQSQSRRSTMQDYGNAAAYPGGMAMGGP